jgi:hypothetical protein
VHQESVPIDRRWLGLDKRGIPYAIVALALIALLHWVIPAIDNATSWNNPIAAGDVLNLGGGIRITPPVGWELKDGIRTSQPPAVPVSADGASAQLSNGSATISVTGAAWGGTASELMDQYNRVRTKSNADPDRLFAATGDRSSITTDDGLTGVQESFTSLNDQGQSYAFVLDDTKGKSIGVVITASTPDDTLGNLNSQIEDFAASLTTTRAGS